MNDIAATRVWGVPAKAKVLVIGHDPRLQKSGAIADYCFFADYYFKPKPSNPRELRKYQLAEALFLYIRELTGGKYKDDELLITNLCNKALPPAPSNKTVYIPPNIAKEGLSNIRELLLTSNVQLILAMAQQVNYWLQKLNFYSSGTGFLELAEPREKGVASEPPYYEAKKGGAFKLICGQKYVADDKYPLFPILHVKNYPLKGQFRTYQDNLVNCIYECKKLRN